MRSVTPRTVAYTACQVRSLIKLYIYLWYHYYQVYVALSNSVSWESKIGYFNLEKFHANIVGLFSDDPNHTWSIETLEYLTEYGFFTTLHLANRTSL